MSITYFKFEELNILPVDDDGFECSARCDGVATINYGSKSRHWQIDAVEIAFTKVIVDPQRPAGEQKVVMTRMVAPPTSILPWLVRELSTPSWRQAIQDHVDEVCSEELIDENRYADVTAP